MHSASPFTVIIIADDLTGANDTAIQYCKRGYSAIVGILYTSEIDIHCFDGHQVIAFNTDTRSLEQEEAYGIVFQATEACLAVRKEDIYKKVDSLLRGNPGRELDAVMDASFTHLAFVAPAYPQNGRIVEDGVLDVQGTTIDAVEIFRKQMHHTVERIDLETVTAES